MPIFSGVRQLLLFQHIKQGMDSDGMSQRDHRHLPFADVDSPAWHGNNALFQQCHKAQSQSGIFIVPVKCMIVIPVQV